MARSQKEIIAIILDVSPNAERHIVNEKEEISFLEEAIFCVKMILQRKIFSQSKDEVAIITFGSGKTKNCLDFENINELCQFSIATWDMINEMDTEVASRNRVNGDWLDAIVVGAQLLRDQTENKTFTEKKLVLLSNFASEVDPDQEEIITQSLKSIGVNLIVIGPDIPNPYVMLSSAGSIGKKQKSTVQRQGEQLISKIINETDGMICSFEDALPQLMEFSKKVQRSVPWYADMDIGSDIRIPIMVYKKIAEVSKPTWKSINGSDMNSAIEREKTYVRQDESLATIDKENIIGGYTFGSTIVPFSDIDKEEMSYKSGPRCLSVIGFTKSKNVPRHIFGGNSVYYVVALKENEGASKAVSAIIHALKDLDMVAIARRVYRKDSTPTMGVMFPIMKEKYECLTYIEVAYAEDLRYFTFPSLMTSNQNPTEEQLQAIDCLIDSMDLMEDDVENGEGYEAFKPSAMLDPFLQHFYYSLGHRVLHPGEIPPKPRPFVLAALDPSPAIQERSQEALEKIKNLFELIVVEKKEPKKIAAEMFQHSDDKANPEVGDGSNANLTSLADMVSVPVVEIGSITPEKDFGTLIENGEPYQQVVKQMCRVISDLVTKSFGSDDFPKAESALKRLRLFCCDTEPNLYNNWIPQFKMHLLERGKLMFWEIIVNNRLGLISSLESHKKPTVSVEEAENFMRICEHTEEREESNIMDAEDLLDEM